MSLSGYRYLYPGRSTTRVLPGGGRRPPSLPALAVLRCEASLAGYRPQLPKGSRGRGGSTRRESRLVVTFREKSVGALAAVVSPSRSPRLTLRTASRMAPSRFL